MEDRKNTGNQGGQEQGSKPEQDGRDAPDTQQGEPKYWFRGTADQDSEADDADDEQDNVVSPARVATRKWWTRNPA